MRKFINLFATVFLLGIIAYCGYNIYVESHEYKIGEETYQEVADIAIVNQPFIPDSKEESLEPVEFLEIDWAALNEINPDIIGWIYCPNTELNYPILKSQDNNDYVHTAVTGIKNSAGSIFLDCRNYSFLLDNNSIIYGHNMKNGSMFKTVNRYKKEEYYKEHPIMHIYTPYSKKIYNVVAAYATTTNDEAYELDLAKEADYKEWVFLMDSKSSYETQVPINPSKRTIVLSTCNGSTGSNKRFLVLLQEQNNPQEIKVAYDFSGIE